MSGYHISDRISLLKVCLITTTSGSHFPTHFLEPLDIRTAASISDITITNMSMYRGMYQSPNRNHVLYL